MSDERAALVICCNGAPPPRKEDCQVLEYRLGHHGRNVLVGLPSIVQDVYHVPDRTLDLLEIAAYVFSADRLAARGRRDQLEYQRWSRTFRFRIRVRDSQFWRTAEIRDALGGALRFMTGDTEYDFDFLSGHSTAPTSLFDVEGFSLGLSATPVATTLFSGGLDSLAGTIETLQGTDRRVILVSHQSQPGTTRTQRQLVAALQERFGKERVAHYQFECHLRSQRATEETQRTRPLLYSSIGFAIASAYGEESFAIYENGVTSINVRRREDLANARASRTTHPQTVARLADLFSLIP